MKLLVFGSRSLTPAHLDAMVERLRLCAGSVPTDETLVLVNGDGPPSSSARGAIGADKLAVVAARIAWRDRPKRIRWFPVRPTPGESWVDAALRRNLEMVHEKPARAICFHTDPELGRGSAHTFAALRGAGVPVTVVLLSSAGAITSVQEF